MDFYENFVRLCNKAGKTPSKVAAEIGISKSIVSRWKNGGGVTDATATKIADYFGVKKSDLIEEKEKPTAVSDDGLSKSQREIIEFAKSVPEDKAAMILRVMKSILEETE